MPITPRIIEAANLFRARLLARERRAAGALVQHYRAGWQRLQGDITALSTEVEAMRLAGETVTRGKLVRLERMRAIQAQVEEELGRFVPFADEAITGQKLESIYSGERESAQLIGYAFPPGAGIDVSFFQMPRAAVRNLAGFVADGTPLNAVIQGYVGSAAEKFSETMVTGLMAGLGPKQIAYELSNAYGIGLTDALRLSRTENLRAYRTAARQTYEANSDIVKGWQRHAAKDDRTCMACIMLDGKLYAVATDMDDHVMGRCALLPVTKTYAELGIDAPEPQFQDETAQEWFERQPESVQRQMMGAGKFDAWKAGEFELEDIPHRTTDAVWGDSWTPKPLYELLGEDAPVGTYAEWVAGREGPDDFLTAIRQRPGGVLDEPGTSDERMRKWLLDDLPATGKNAFAKDEIVTMLSERAGVSYEEANTFIRQWAESSNDTDMRSLAIQEDAAKMLGIDLPQWQASKLTELRAAQTAKIQASLPLGPNVSEAHVEAITSAVRTTNPELFPMMDSDKQQRLLRAMYDRTQERLDAAGIGDTIRLRRGMTVDNAITDAWRDRSPSRSLIHQTVEYNGSVLESWATDTTTARNFAGGAASGETGIVFEMDIPRERLIASARSGFGCLDEFEFVHLGAFGDEQAIIIEVFAR